MTEYSTGLLDPFTGNRVFVSPRYIAAQGEALCPRKAHRRLVSRSSALRQARRGIEPEPARVGKMKSNMS